MSLFQTILFADICRSSRLYELMGDEAANAIIKGCLLQLSGVVCQYGGQLVKEIGDEVMAVFPQADATVNAAIEMQEKINLYSASNGLQIGLRIGLNFGPVILDNDDVFGNTVNAAARMAKFAKSGQIITNQATIKVLPTAFQSQTRLMDRIPSPGKTERMSVYQIIWERRELTSARTYLGGSIITFTTVLQLTHHSKVVPIKPDQSGFTIGRNPENDLMVCDDYTSRQHAQIDFRKGKFILIDQSTNGTFIVRPDGSHIFIHREESVLQDQGWIGLGELRFKDHPDVIAFEINTPPPAT
jgi:adenylate cyclase